MPEYIEREELKKVLSNEAVHCLTFQKTGEARGLIKAKEIISKLPSADVVEVVRCKDCERFIPKEKLNPTKYINPLEADGLCVNCDKYTDADDFCSYGELKEREGE